MISARSTPKPTSTRLFRAVYVVGERSHRRHPLIVGRKGTGKNRDSKGFASTQRTLTPIFATDLAARDHPWNAHHAVFDESVGGKSRHLKRGLFLMLVELGKLAAAEDQQPLDEEVAGYVRMFIEENWGSLAFDHRTRSAPLITKSLRASHPKHWVSRFGSVD